MTTFLTNKTNDLTKPDFDSEFKRNINVVIEDNTVSSFELYNKKHSYWSCYKSTIIP